MRDVGLPPRIERSAPTRRRIPFRERGEQHDRAAAFLGPQRMFVRVGLGAELFDLLAGTGASLGGVTRAV
jgi:hypothetical protein